MADKEADLGSLRPIVKADDMTEIPIDMPESIRDNVPVLRRLARYLVDLAAHYGKAQWLLDDIEFGFSHLGVHITTDYVSRLIRKAVAAEEAARRRAGATTAPVKPKASTKTASKRKAKKTPKKTKTRASRRKEAGRD